jgi:hypothetical protein
MEETHDDEQSDAWQTVGAVTAKLLLQITVIDLNPDDDDEDVEPDPER